MRDREGASPSGLQAEELLRSFFSGRRNGSRKVTRLSLAVGTRRTPYEARTLDLSRSGILFEILDPALQPGEGAQELVAYHERVREMFREGIALEFGGGALRLHAELVRVVVAPPTEGCRALLGCRFRRRLTRGQCRLLGVAHEGDGYF